MSNADTYIGNYRVISQIFSDPFSHVYLAEHTYTSRRSVAIRLWQTVHFNSTQEYSAFLQEAQTLVTLTHPYILSLIDLGVEVDAPYIVTEYIYTSMGTLRDRIRQQGQRPFQAQEAFSILSQIGQALYQAHQQNVIHRQLAPEHVVFNMRGEAVVADFGLLTILNAPAIRHIDRLNSDPYAAPEQFQGRVDKQSDQYALGAIAYELFTGYPPAQPPVPPTQINPALPISIEQAILKALARDENDRHADIATFMRALFATPIPDARPTAVPVLEDHTMVAGASSPMNMGSPTPPLGLNAPIYEERTMVADAASPIGADMPAPVSGESPAPSWSYASSAMPYQPALGSVQGPSWASANTTENSRLVGAYAAPHTAGVVGASARTPRKRNRRAILFAVIAIIVLLAASIPFVGPYLWSIVPASAATVTITPTTKSLSNTYTIDAVTGTPDPTKHQAPLRTVTYTTPAKTGTAKATGKGNQAATNATGTLVFSQASEDASFAAGQTLTSNSGVQIATDAGFSIKAGATASIAAHAMTAGPGGNIPALDINNQYGITDQTGNQTGTITIQNTQAFTGGDNPTDYVAVQQSDIDGVATSFEPQLTTDAQTQAQKLVHTAEKLTDQFKCTPNVNPNHKANDKANDVTVSVTVTCQAEAYVPQTVQAAAAEWLKSDGNTQFGTDYALFGKITTSAPREIAQTGNGGASFSVPASGAWAFQFTDAQEQGFAHSIAGKTQADGKALLLKQTGINAVSVSTTGFFGGAFPSAASDIKFVEAKMG